MSATRNALEDLRVTRDEAKLKVHLLSMEARERWRELEQSIDNLEHYLNQGGAQLSEAASERLRQLKTGVAEFVRSQGLYGSGCLQPVRVQMTHNVSTCRSDDTLNRAAQLLWENDCGVLPVLHDGRVVGMITDRDICMAAYTQGGPLASLSVSSAMSRQLYACSPDDTLQRAMGIMADKQVRRLPVIDGEGKLLGVLALADVAIYLAHRQAVEPEATELLSGTLAAISQPPNTRADALPRPAAGRVTARESP